MKVTSEEGIVKAWRWAIVLVAATATRALADDDDKKLQAALAAFDTRGILKPVLPVSKPDVIVWGLSCDLGRDAVRVTELQAQLTALKSKLLAALSEISVAAPLRAHIEQNFPSVPQGTRSACYWTAMTDSRAALNVQRDAERFVSDVVRKGGKAIDVVKFSTAPSSALFEYWPYALPDASHVVPVPTNSQKKHVYRGLYGYKVTKDGYVTIEDKTLDLMDGDSITISCELKEKPETDAGTAETALPCEVQ